MIIRKLFALGKRVVSYCLYGQNGKEVGKAVNGIRTFRNYNSVWNVEQDGNIIKMVTKHLNGSTTSQHFVKEYGMNGIFYNGKLNILHNGKITFMPNNVGKFWGKAARELHSKLNK